MKETPIVVTTPVVVKQPFVEQKVVTPAVKESAVAASQAVAGVNAQAASQVSVGSTKSPQVINNNVWTQTQTYAPVNTFNINSNTLGGVTTGDQEKMHSDIDNKAFIKVDIDQSANFAPQIQKNTVDIKNVEVTKTITNTVDIDKTVTIDSYNTLNVDLPRA